MTQPFPDNVDDFVPVYKTPWPTAAELKLADSDTSDDTKSVGDCGQDDDGTFGDGNTCAADGGGTAVADDERDHVGDAERDWQENGVRAEAFKEWFGDWEHDPDNASKVVDKTGRPQQNHPIPGTGSVVTDEGGEPLIMYHGTQSGGYDTFDKDKVEGDNLFGPGFYFTQDRIVAGEYAGEADVVAMAKPGPDSRNVPPKLGDTFAGGVVSRVEDTGDGYLHIHFASSKDAEVKSVYLNIRNPFNMDTRVTESHAKEMITAISPGAFEDETFENYTAGYRGSGKTWNMRGSDVWELVSRRSQVAPAKMNEAFSAMGYDGFTHIGGLRVGQGNRQHRVYIALEPTQIKSTTNRGTFNPDDPNINKGLL